MIAERGMDDLAVHVPRGLSLLAHHDPNAVVVRLSGFFALVTTWTVRRARTPTVLLAAVIVVSGVLSALFVKDIVCLVLAPLVVDLVRRLRLPPLPYLIALATASNVGSVATLTGDPPP
jgi:Na+/H+ antiporter NhaD/arsenite permease-like protein